MKHFKLSLMVGMMALFAQGVVANPLESDPNKPVGTITFGHPLVPTEPAPAPSAEPRLNLLHPEYRTEPAPVRARESDRKSNRRLE